MRAVSATTSAENGGPEGGMISEETRGAIQPIISTGMAALPGSSGASEPGLYHANQGVVRLGRLLGDVGWIWRSGGDGRRGSGVITGEAEAAVILGGFVRIVDKRQMRPVRALVGLSDVPPAIPGRAFPGGRAGQPGVLRQPLPLHHRAHGTGQIGRASCRE